jgi:signal transduction histidine kinase
MTGDTMSSALDQTESRSTRRRDDDGAPHEAGDVRHRPVIAVFMARVTVTSVVVGFCLIALLYVISSNLGVTRTVLATVYLLVLVGLQEFYFSWPDVQLGSRLSYLMLAIQAALVYLPVLQFTEAWVGLPSLLAGTVLLVLPPAVAWPVFAAIVASVGWLELAVGGPTLDAAYIAVSALVFGLELYGLTRLAGHISELHAARTELAKVAVAHERLRFARDLHEVLGLRLSAIAPKGELAHRLVTKDPNRARRELSEILEMSRRALADVRSVARGYRELNLDEASRAASSVLAAASVDVQMTVKHGELPVRIRGLLAAVLREGASNVLQHSIAERCEIALRQSGDQVFLDMVNDGVIDPADAAAGLPEGGIERLAVQVVKLGGELIAQLDEDGGFHLRMRVPVSPAEEPAADPESPEPVPRYARQLATVLLTVVLCGLFFQAALHLADLTDHGRLAAGVTYMLVMLLLQLFYMGRPGTQLRSPLSYAVLLVQACLAFLPTVQFGLAWVALPGFLGGSVLLVLPAAAAWPAYTVLMGAIGVVTAVQGGSWVSVGYNVIGVAFISFAVYGLTWMVRAVAELRAARVQLAQAAVAEERLRFARDLHDLLGLSLSAITLKSELAHRLVTADAARAREELTEILDISRLALADVRSVAGGQQELSLSEEFRSAESLLVAAEVDVRMDLRYGEIPDHVGTVLATVLREGVTNVLRHSKGEYCEITVHQQDHSVLLDIINDGVTETPELSSRNGGSGLGNLSARVGMIGGELTAGVCPDGRFRLHAKVPL